MSGERVRDPGVPVSSWGDKGHTLGHWVCVARRAERAGCPGREG